MIMIYIIVSLVNVFLHIVKGIRTVKINIMAPHAQKLMIGFSINTKPACEIIANQFNPSAVNFPSGQKAILIDLYSIPVDYNIGSFLDLLESEGVIYRTAIQKYKDTHNNPNQ